VSFREVARASSEHVVFRSQRESIDTTAAPPGCSISLVLQQPYV